MKASKFLPVLCLCLLLNLCFLPTRAEAASESDLTFTLNEDGESYSVTKCSASAGGGMVILGLGALTVFYLVMFVIALAIISPFITLFVLDDIVDTFIVNKYFFAAKQLKI